jgi:2-oxo-4-hydroxy-4-carboxy-5-ureidoimidazoline decarboxylase
MKVTIEYLNAMDQSSFTELLGGIFEHSPWVAHGAWASRPFDSAAHLLDAMMRVVQLEAPDDKVSALIRAHPDLAARIRLTPDSAREQQGAGLDSLTPEEFAAFSELNRAYTGKFGFPFILAVRGMNKTDIRQAMLERMEESPDSERETALRQIRKIAGFRLGDLIDDDKRG